MVISTCRQFLRCVVFGIAGIALALPVAYFAARNLGALLFGVTPIDPMIYGAAAVVTLLMTLAGHYN